MPTDLTSEQILALAPDKSVAQSGRSLANLRNWERLGQQATTLWGECQGSGKDAYKVQIDLREPAFRCTCPSRKFPCKHGIALLLLLASQPASFPQSDPPPWVSEWLAKRDQTTQRKGEKAQGEPSATESKKRAANQEKRALSREANVATGLDELQQWMHDLLRQGLATVQNRGPAIWDAMAARMIDVQAPGVARILRDMGGIPASGDGWQRRLLEHMARLHLLIEGYAHREHLPPDLLADVRTSIGWAQDQDAVRAKPSVRDQWLVLGQQVEEEDQLRVQRTWLWSKTNQQPAMLLAFAAPGQPLERNAVIGTVIDAEIAYFDSAFPLRALLTQRHSAPETQTAFTGYPSIEDALSAYTDALARNPWLDRFLFPLQAVAPVFEQKRWYVRDSDGHVLPLFVKGSQGWRLTAISGGQPLALVGSWDGDGLTVLSASSDGQLLSIEP